MAMGRLAMGLMALLVLGSMAEYDDGEDYGCELNWVRGYGGYSNNSDVAVEKGARMCRCKMEATVMANSYTDIQRLENSYALLVEMPGVVSDDDVKVEVVEHLTAGRRLLYIAGTSRDVDVGNVIRIRSDRGPLTKLFARKFLLPLHVDPARISHHLHHGLLRVTLPLLSTVSDLGEQQASVKVEKHVLSELRDRIGLCTIDNREVDRIQPEPLPLAAAADDDKSFWSVITIPALADVFQSKHRVDPEWYEMVVEMPGARWAEVKVEECDDHEEGCTVVSVAGVVEDDDDGGDAVRIERGRASRKVFARRLKLPGIVRLDGGYQLNHGLLRVRLLRTVNVWDSVLLALTRSYGSV